jgi:hypothetical protein
MGETNKPEGAAHGTSGSTPPVPMEPKSGGWPTFGAV